MVGANNPQQVGSGLLFRLVLRFLCISIVLLCCKVSQAVVYVDRDKSGGNGTSWSQAFKTLDAALAAYPDSAQEFWIAEGTYVPADPNGYVLGMNQNHSFYGGFAGTETSLAQRDINAHPVIFDGQGTHTHLFYATSHVDSVRFDGLTIQGGAATGLKDSDTGQGAGIVINQLSSAVIANCTFKSNSANGLGGAVAVYDTPVVISVSKFLNNSSLQSGGGGVSLYWSRIGTKPTAIIEKSYFFGNQASLDGGAVYEGYYDLTLRDSIFIANSSALEAGAVKLDYNNGGVNKIQRCLFFDNQVTGNGGGAIQSYEQSVSVENSVFANNSTSGIGLGGAIYLHGGTNGTYAATIANSTFYGNQTNNWGGAIMCTNVPMLYLYNSILWGNSAVKYFVAGQPTDDLALMNGSYLTMRYTDIESLNWNYGAAGQSVNGCFSADPQFVDTDGMDNVFGTWDDNLSIQGTSPCTDHADGNFAPATDYGKRPRVDNSTVANLGTGSPGYADVGAYEGPYSPQPPPEPPSPPSPPPSGKFNIAPITLLL